MALAAAAVAAAVWLGALQWGFSQDDFLGLARATGLAPRLAGPWRILANQLFWDAGVRLFGLHALPFHAVVLAVHAAACALLGAMLARRLPAPAAFAAAAAYAAHPAHQLAIYWISANSDPFATLFSLLATAAFFSRGARRWLALPAFAIALAWKESVLLLPLALLAAAWLGPADRPAMRAILRDPVLLALGAIAAAWGAGIAAFMGRLDRAGNAYEASLAAVPANLLTYVSWTPSWANWVQRDLSDGPRPAFLVMGGALLAVALAGLAWSAWRRRGAAGSLLAAALLVAPVLPLAHHTYRYYLHLPLAALSFAIGGLFAAATARLARGAAWAACAGVAAVLVGSAYASVRLIEVTPFVLEGSHLDRTIDRAVVAHNAIADLRAARLPRHASLAFWSPASQQVASDLGQDVTHETYEERNVRTALLDGLAVRVMVSGIDSIRFVRSFEPGDRRDLWAVYGPDGHLDVLPAAALARELARGTP